MPVSSEGDAELTVALAVRWLRRQGIDGTEAERQGILVPNELAVLTDGELDAWIDHLRGRGEPS